MPGFQALASNGKATERHLTPRTGIEGIQGGGDYRQVEPESLEALAPERFDLALATFPFDNLPTHARKVRALAQLRERLAPEGRIVNVVSAPEIYRNEWVSFTTRDYPENARRRHRRRRAHRQPRDLGSTPR